MQLVHTIPCWRGDFIANSRVPASHTAYGLHSVNRCSSSFINVLPVHDAQTKSFTDDDALSTNCPTLHTLTLLQLSAPSIPLYSSTPSHAEQILFSFGAVPFGHKSRHSPDSAWNSGQQFRFEMSVGALDSRRPSGHGVTVEHVPWFAISEKLSFKTQSPHDRSDTNVAATDTYLPASQSVSTSHSVCIASGWNVLFCVHAVHIRSELGVGSVSINVPGSQLCVASQDNWPPSDWN